MLICYTSSSHGPNVQLLVDFLFIFPFLQEVGIYKSIPMFWSCDHATLHFDWAMEGGRLLAGNHSHVDVVLTGCVE